MKTGEKKRCCKNNQKKEKKKKTCWGGRPGGLVLGREASAEDVRNLRERLRKSIKTRTEGANCIGKKRKGCLPFPRGVNSKKSHRMLGEKRHPKLKKVLRCAKSFFATKGGASLVATDQRTHW